MGKMKELWAQQQEQKNFDVEAPLEPMEDEGIISELKVMKSAAGFYIGRSITEMGFPMPYSRDSQEYYPTEEEAQRALSGNTYTRRYHP
jgi:hypothetical protein